MRALYSKSGDVLCDKVSLGDKTLLSKSKGKCLQRDIRAFQRVVSYSGNVGAFELLIHSFKNI